jgi:D-alanyl-lipoteichoic acid acyltransferase DltB (MBOAT superfamily)
MLPQLAREPRFDPDQQARGLIQIATGLVKKVAIGDVLAAGLVNRVFDNPERYSALEVLVAVYAYAFQIYADFSGYTDVAIGSAKLFGYELPPNFARPYASKDLQEFWKRWHISLSTWLRDYLYIPLGGSRGTDWKTYRNLIITMILGGLWHGASWNFVIWGTMHGLALAVTRLWQRSSLSHRGSSIWDALCVLGTFNFVCLCWIFFRASTFEHARLILLRLATLTSDSSNLSLRTVLVLALAIFAHGFPSRTAAECKAWLARQPSLIQGLALAAVALLLHAAAGAKPEPFVYGQF